MKDIFINNEWDFNISINGDIETVSGVNALKQEIYLAINEDIKKGLITIYPTNLSNFNGGIVDEETIDEIKNRIEESIYALHPELDIEFSTPIISNDQKLFILFTVSYGDKINYKYSIYFNSNKLFVNYVN